MPEAFDPYRKWLGIPPREQPPHHYRLLGIAAFEDDADVIEHAAARQMAHLRTLQNSKHAAHSQRLLSEISAAKLCLLKADSKAAYDAALHDRLAAAGKLLSSQAASSAAEEDVVEAIADVPSSARLGGRWREEGLLDPVGVAPPPVPIPMPPPLAAPAATQLLAEPRSDHVGVPVIRRRLSSTATLARTRRKRTALPIILTVVSLLVLTGVGGVALVLANRQALDTVLNLGTTTQPKAVPAPVDMAKPPAAAPAGDTKGDLPDAAPPPAASAVPSNGGR
jgi:hypothetical protein